MKRSSKIIIPVVIVVAGFLAMVGLISLKSTPEKRAAVVQPKSVETKIVSMSEIMTTVTAYGRVSSAQPVELYSEVVGVLEPGDVPFRPAQSFSRGDLLIKVDNRQATLDLNSKKSDLLTALATVLPEIKVDFPDEYRVWQEYFNRCSFDTELDPLPETSNQKIKLFLSRFNVYKLYFSVRDAEIKLEKHRIYAPFDGSIVTTQLRSGATVRSGSLLGQIINLEQLEVEVPVAAEDLPWIDDTRPVTFTSTELPGEWAGKIVRVGSTIDTKTQTVPVYVRIDDRDVSSLVTGVFLEAHIPGRGIKQAVSLPRKALYADQYVYLVRNGVFEYQPVSVARRQTDSVILNGGIVEGDTLVVQLLQGITSGMPAQARLLSGAEETN
ncbi:MAG: efflux RND transporter periplasmic adaptor subunit [candidate division Zixibacteria bacterium]|nr:efflux RND transporter periplasmic adaptor subunit [candidate division Zixibacteria bacterium]